MSRFHTRSIRVSFGWRTSVKSMLLLLLVSGCIMSTGCAYTGSFQNYVHNGFKVGPNYRKPAAPVAHEWIDSYDDRVLSELSDTPEWWTVFDDPILTQLVQNAYQENLPLRVAGLRVLQAQAQRGIAVGSFFPQQQELTASFSRTTLSKEVAPGNIPFSPRAETVWGNHGRMAWEIDLWGKFRRNIESADASLQADIENYDEILVCLLADTATAYVQYRVLQKQLEYARQNVEIQEGSLAIAEARQRAGGDSELDVTQAKTNLSNTRRLIPVFENRLRIANNALCTLQGIPPVDLSEQLGDGAIPVSPKTVAVGIPANLLRRRPDVLRAERLVAAQSARIGVAAADWFPAVTIAGSLGYAGNDLDRLFTQPAFTGFIQPQLNWPVLNYGRILNNVRVQDALFQQAAVTYQQTVLSANTEAENAINSFLKSQEALVEAEAAVAASKRSVELALIQYKNGATDFNRVFNLQLALVQDQNTLATSQGEIPSSLIALYKALGGGWQIRLGNQVSGGVVSEEVATPKPEDGEEPEAAKPEAAEPEPLILPPAPAE
ncbi:MAG: transporter [Blastopirellula sp.]|nr:transporter [Blastopirellula sp.]